VKTLYFTKLTFAGFVCAVALVSNALAKKIDIPSGDLESALNAYTEQTGVPVLVSNNAIKGVHTGGVKGDLSETDALARLTGNAPRVFGHFCRTSLAMAGVGCRILCWKICSRPPRHQHELSALFDRKT
jgi:hypothetical protein